MPLIPPLIAAPKSPVVWMELFDELRSERNVGEDYRRCFGGDPPEVIAIGLMSDTDDTGGHALAYFDELRVSRRP